MAMFSRRLTLLTAVVVMAALSVQPVAAKPKAHHAATKPTPAKKTPPAPAIPAIVIPTSEPGLLPDMSLGSPTAPVTVIEYASAACSHCAAWNADVWPTFQAKYVATGKVRYIFREVLTNPQQYALSAFLLGRCAVTHSKDPGNSAPYFAVVNSFFSGQKAYFTDNVISPIMTDVRTKTGMSQADVQACIGDSAGFSAFMANMNARTKADHVSGTPTFFVNGQRIKGHDLADLDAAIAAAN